MAEQGFLCCYCERRLINEDSHIEHFRPQNDPFVTRSITAIFLLLPEQDSQGRSTPLREPENGWFDEALLVSPLSVDCEERFRFTGDGLIYPAKVDDSGAETTIRNR